MKLTHMSASQINLFLAEPAVWWLKYVKGIQGEMGPAAHRGTAVEAGLIALLFGNDPKVDNYTLGQGAMVDAYNMLVQGDLGDDAQKQRGFLRDMYEQAAKAIHTQGVPLTTQRKIVLNDPDLPCPLLGFIDFHYPTRNVDLKTTERCPSEPRIEHARQLAIYRKATNEPQWLLYVTPKRAAMYEVTEAMTEELWPSIKAACRAMAKALEIGDHTLFPPRDMTSFYWDARTKSAAKELWI